MACVTTFNKLLNPDLLPFYVPLLLVTCFQYSNGNFNNLVSTRKRTEFRRQKYLLDARHEFGCDSASVDTFTLISLHFPKCEWNASSAGPLAALHFHALAHFSLTFRVAERELKGGGEARGFLVVKRE